MISQKSAKQHFGMSCSAIDESCDALRPPVVRATSQEPLPTHSYGRKCENIVLPLQFCRSFLRRHLVRALLCYTYFVFACAGLKVKGNTHLVTQVFPVVAVILLLLHISLSD